MLVTNSNATGGADRGTVLEVYRSNNAVSGDETARLQFAGKDATNTKRITGAVRSVPQGINPMFSDLVLSTIETNTLTDMLTMSGTSSRVVFNRPANFQGTQPIENVDSITTSASACRYSPNVTAGFKEFSASVPDPGPIIGHSLFLYNEGIDPTVRFTLFVGSPNRKVYDSVEFFSSATATTNVYFATDQGVSFYDGVAVTQLVQLNGRALCMTLFDNQILVGGEFSQDGIGNPYSLLLLIDSMHNINQFAYANYGGNEGFSGAQVSALATDGSGWLYIGGKFNKTGGGALGVSNFAIVNSPAANTYNVFAIDDNSAGSPNGLSSAVYSILIDPVVGRTRLVLGGNFMSTQCSPGGSPITTSDQFATVWYNLGDQNSDPAAGNPSGVPFQYVGSSPATFNDVVLVVAARTTDVYFGGQATNIDGLGVNYLVYADAGVYDTVYDGNPGGMYTNPVTALAYKTLPTLGSYWWVGDQAGQIWLNDLTLVLVLGGIVNRVVWSLSYAVFLLESDDPNTYQYNPSNTVTLSFSSGQVLKVYPNLSYSGGINLTNAWSLVDMKFIGSSTYLLTNSQGTATFF